MEQFAGWMFLITLAIVNTVVYMLIDGYFKGDIEGVKDDDIYDESI
jgi:hypothetical protein